MRLLRLDSDNEFSLVEYVGRNIPRYAILSHTWGADDEEVTFRDLAEGTGKSKAGYRKLRFCGKQAANDGLQFFWADTCCIDKASSAELTEAINSMFQWYQCCTKCYVYLEDIEYPGDTGLDEENFNRCRWITRGWTLQELIAPREVHFYSKDWRYCGERRQLAKTLAKVTNIAHPILSRSETDFPLSVFSAYQRMSWAAKRTTTRPEDMAYCLLGLFDVNMPLLYGEGGANAFFRLQEEILKKSIDHSLFAWVPFSPNASKSTWYQGCLAQGPQDFWPIFPVVKSLSEEEPYEMTNKGLRITLPLIEVKHLDQSSHFHQQLPGHTTHVAALSCHIEDNFSGPLGIGLAPAVYKSDNVFDRVRAPPGIIEENSMRKAKSRPIYLAKFLMHHSTPEQDTYVDIDWSYSRSVPTKQKSGLLELHRLELDPSAPWFWNSETKILRLPAYPKIWPCPAIMTVRFRGSKQAPLFNIACDTNRLGEPEIWVVDEREADSFEEMQQPERYENPRELRSCTVFKYTHSEKRMGKWVYVVRLEITPKDGWRNINE